MFLVLWDILHRVVNWLLKGKFWILQISNCCWIYHAIPWLSLFEGKIRTVQSSNRSRNRQSTLYYSGRYMWNTRGLFLSKNERYQDFWKRLSSGQYSNLRKFALNIHAMFGSRYTCDSKFSIIERVKWNTQQDGRKKCWMLACGYSASRSASILTLCSRTGNTFRKVIKIYLRYLIRFPSFVCFNLLKNVS